MKFILSIIVVLTDLALIFTCVNANRYKGKGQKFELASRRDIALVNKATDFLKDELLIPPKWMQLENKGLVRGQDGRWTQPERQDLGDHFEGVNLEAGLV